MLISWVIRLNENTIVFDVKNVFVYWQLVQGKRRYLGQYKYDDYLCLQDVCEDEDSFFNEFIFFQSFLFFFLTMIMVIHSLGDFYPSFHSIYLVFVSIKHSSGMECIISFLYLFIYIIFSVVFWDIYVRFFNILRLSEEPDATRHPFIWCVEK